MDIFLLLLLQEEVSRHRQKPGYKFRAEEAKIKMVVVRWPWRNAPAWGGKIKSCAYLVENRRGFFAKLRLRRVEIS